MSRKKLVNKINVNTVAIHEVMFWNRSRQMCTLPLRCYRRRLRSGNTGSARIIPLVTDYIWKCKFNIISYTLYFKFQVLHHRFCKFQSFLYAVCHVSRTDLFIYYLLLGHVCDLTLVLNLTNLIFRLRRYVNFVPPNDINLCFWCTVFLFEQRSLFYLTDFRVTQSL